MPLGASLEPPRRSAETPSLKVRSSIIASVIGRKASAARPPDTIRPWYSARSTLPVLVRTAYVPMIEATSDTPPITSG
jgi:hypothetical protein